jgi:phenylacetate-CoA ligase
MMRKHRYHIGDNGGLISFEDMFQVLEKEGIDVAACLSGDYPVRRQPFCWVFGRAHWAVSLFGANVFVDQVMGELCDDT